MHRYTGNYRQFNGCGFTADDVNARTINVNVANITQVVRSNRQAEGWHGGGHKQVKKHVEHPPRLLRHCASFGLLDSHVSYGMSDAERCVEASKVIGYAARGLGRNVGNMAKSAVDASICFAKGAIGIVEAIFG